MATEDSEQAEIQRVRAKIDDLRERISYEKDEQKRLNAERTEVINSVIQLEAKAESMSKIVSKDVGDLRGRISREDIDARDLLQLLRDVSRKYITYKSLSTATKDLSSYTNEYFQHFSFYENLRRLSLGFIIAVDINIISLERARGQVERAYTENTNYWLAYAVMAVVLWWSNEREASSRAMKKALAMNERKSALLFLFCNLKFGRREAAIKWYSYYLSRIHANDVGDEYQYLLEAYLSGSFGNENELESEVGSQFNAMVKEITNFDIDYNKKVSEAATRFMETKSHVTDFDFFYLAEYCTDYELMKNLLNSAEKNTIAADEFQEIANVESSASDIDEKLENSICNLIDSMDEEEEKVYLNIKRNELIVAARGDVEVAEKAFEERYPVEPPVTLGDLMQKWAFTEDDPRILPEVRRFSLGRLAGSIRAGFKQFANSYRNLYKEGFEIKLGKWTCECKENELEAIEENYSSYFDKHNFLNYFKDKFILVWIAMVLAGVAFMVFAAIKLPEPTLIIMGFLFVSVGAFMLWRQISDVKAALQRRKLKDIDIIRKTVKEMEAWRKRYKEADGAHDVLIQATYLFEG